MSSDDERGYASGGIKEVQDDDMKADELRDEILFKQPESSHIGDCPICCLPIDFKNSLIMSCCSKRICSGCMHANRMRQKEGRLEIKCPFCRQPPIKSEEESKIHRMKRVEANDPIALTHIGARCIIEGDYKKGFEYYTKAAKLGQIDAHYGLSCMYSHGDGVEKDKKKRLFHLEEAAIGGHANARYNLGIVEWENKRNDRAIKHHIIAAKMGHVKSLEWLKKNYANGYVAKEDFASALRGHHAAVKAMKSPQREAAEAFRQKAEAARAARQK